MWRVGFVDDKAHRVSWRPALSRLNHIPGARGTQVSCLVLGCSAGFSVRLERRVVSSGCESRPATVAAAGST